MFYPIGYGADPTGAEDSTDALLKAVEEAFQLKSGLELLPGITDLGGVVIDLQGGNYKISQPLRFPSGAGNVVVSLFFPLSVSVCVMVVLLDNSTSPRINSLSDTANKFRYKNYNIYLQSLAVKTKP